MRRHTPHTTHPRGLADPGDSTSASSWFSSSPPRRRGARARQEDCRPHTPKAWLRALQRIRLLVQDTHRKCAKILCDTYDVVFIPEFNSKSMVEKSRGFRRINSKTARAMMTSSHYKFRQLLISKAEETGTKVVVVTEEYTTVTCGACGHVRAKFSGKHFHCPSCGFNCDRDINGARNILIKSLVEFGLHLSAPFGALGPIPCSGELHWRWT